MDALLQLAFGLQVEVDRAVHGAAGDGERTDQQRVGLEQIDESAGELVVGPDGDAADGVADGDAEHEGRAGAREREGEVPVPAPPARIALAAELDRDGAADQRREQQHEGQVEGAERGGVGDGEGGEQRAAEGHEPDLVAVPQRADGVHHDAALLVAADEQVQHADAEVEAVEDGVAGEQHAQKEEPQDVQVHLESSVPSPPGSVSE